MRNLLLGLIELYQRTLSPDVGWRKVIYPGGYCKFRPHCSEYCKQAIIKHGLWRGGRVSLWRILRCNPWSRGGVDLP